MAARVRSLTETLVDRVDRRLLDTVVAIVAWLAAWVAVRLVGGDGLVAASAFAVPVAYVGHRFGWHAGALLALASAVVAGPLSPVPGAAVTDAQTLTFAAVFTALAGVSSLARETPRDATPDRLALDLTSYAGIARDLRTPLHAIDGAVAVLTRRVPDEREIQSALTTLRQAAGRLGDLEELLAAVSHELAVERRDDDQVPVDLRATVGDLAVQLRDRGGLDRIRFDAAHDADVLVSHAERVRLLLHCLVGDALRSTTSDQPVDVSVRRDVDTVVVRVCTSSAGAGQLACNIRVVAAKELTTRLGGSLDAVDAGGAIQLTVRLPQRRGTDPSGSTPRSAHPQTRALPGATSPPPVTAGTGDTARSRLDG